MSYYITLLHVELMSRARILYGFKTNYYVISHKITNTGPMLENFQNMLVGSKDTYISFHSIYKSH